MDEHDRNIMQRFNEQFTDRDIDLAMAHNNLWHFCNILFPNFFKDDREYLTDMCDRIEKMKLDEGSYINLVGKLDEETWTDGEGKPRSAMVIILDDIEYAGAGKPKDGTANGNTQAGNAGNANAPAASGAPGQDATTPDNFTGFQNFGGSGGMFDEN